MKKILSVCISICLLLITFSTGYAQNGNGKRNRQNQTCQMNSCCYVQSSLDNSSIKPISENEKSTMAFMREEEKLAHDVYSKFNQLWNRQVFTHILQSEQQHMEVMLSLESAYGVTDLVGKNKAGVFTNKTLQHLYDSLVKVGSESMIRALQASAFIEDRNLRDFDVAIAQTGEQNLITTYGNLHSASENHMSAFINNLKMQNSSYEPQFISKEEFNKIVSVNKGCCLQ